MAIDREFSNNLASRLDASAAGVVTLSEIKHGAAGDGSYARTLAA